MDKIKYYQEKYNFVDLSLDEIEECIEEALHLSLKSYSNPRTLTSSNDIIFIHALKKIDKSCTIEIIEKFINNIVKYDNSFFCIKKFLMLLNYTNYKLTKEDERRLAKSYGFGVIFDDFFGEFTSLTTLDIKKIKVDIISNIFLNIAINRGYKIDGKRLVTKNQAREYLYLLNDLDLEEEKKLKLIAKGIKSYDGTMSLEEYLHFYFENNLLGRRSRS